MSAISGTLCSTNTPNFSAVAGKCEVMSATCSTVMRRLLSAANTNPTASAPALIACCASSRDVLPQIFPHIRLTPPVPPSTATAARRPDSAASSETLQSRKLRNHKRADAAGLRRSEYRFQIDFKSFQIAAIYSNHFAVQIYDPHQLFFVVHFTQDVEIHRPSGYA